MLQFSGHQQCTTDQSVNLPLPAMSPLPYLSFLNFPPLSAYLHVHLKLAFLGISGHLVLVQQILVLLVLLLLQQLQLSQILLPAHHAKRTHDALTGGTVYTATSTFFKKRKEKKTIMYTMLMNAAFCSSWNYGKMQSSTLVPLCTARWNSFRADNYCPLQVLQALPLQVVILTHLSVRPDIFQTTV